MATTTTSSGHPKLRAAIGERTLRRDAWWASPAGIAAILLFFVFYTLIRIYMAKWYYAEDYHYLTPLYSPCLSKSCVAGSAHFGTPLPELPFFLPLGIISFPIIAGFRVTCYYYRKAGYRSLWLSPAACAIPEPRKNYTGETRFPLILMNAHRYFWYFAVVVLFINFYDTGLAFTGIEGGFGVGLGSLIMLVNVVLLAGYTFSCHACRHAVGGRINHFSKHPVRYWMWTAVSKMNPQHGAYAMASLFTVIITDAYIMAVSAGWFADPRLFN